MIISHDWIQVKHLEQEYDLCYCVLPLISLQGAHDVSLPNMTDAEFGHLVKVAMSVFFIINVLFLCIINK